MKDRDVTVGIIAELMIAFPLLGRNPDRWKADASAMLRSLGDESYWAMFGGVETRSELGF